MARLTDPDILARYHQALAEWGVKGAIELVGRAHEELRATLEGVAVDGFKEALYRFVCEENGEIDQVKEKREHHRDHWEWHYRLRATGQNSCQQLTASYEQLESPGGSSNETN